MLLYEARMARRHFFFATLHIALLSLGLGTDPARATGELPGRCRYLCMTAFADLQISEQIGAHGRAMEFSLNQALQRYARAACGVGADRVLVPFIPSFVGMRGLEDVCPAGDSLLFSTGLVFLAGSHYSEAGGMSGVSALCYISFDALFRADRSGLSQRMERFIGRHSTPAVADCVAPRSMQGPDGVNVPFIQARGSSLHAAAFGGDGEIHR